MGQGRSVARVAVVEVIEDRPVSNPPRKSESNPEPTGGSPPADLTPWYAAALLKLAVELRREEPPALEETIDRVIQETPLERQAFRGYVQRNFSLLRRA